MSKLKKSVLTFSSCGVLAGLAFALITTRPASQNFWFSVSEYWVVPTSRCWLLAEAFFIMALAGAYFGVTSKGWMLPARRSRFNSRTVVFAAGGIVVIVLLTTQRPELALLITFLLLPGALLILLYLFSGRWDGMIATLIILTNIAATLLASIPDLLLNSSLSPVAFQLLKAALTWGTLAGLSGLWLFRAAQRSLQ